MKSAFEALVRFSIISLNARKFQVLSHYAGTLKATPLTEKMTRTGRKPRKTL